LQQDKTIRALERRAVTNSDQEPPKQLIADLQREFGHLMTGDLLWKTLGFKSSAAFRQAKSRGVIGVRLFKIPNRRGTFATTAEVAKWLQKISAAEENQS
jgi:hypothetical protein